MWPVNPHASSYIRFLHKTHFVSYSDMRNCNERSKRKKKRRRKKKQIEKRERVEKRKKKDKQTERTKNYIYTEITWIVTWCRTRVFLTTLFA